MKCYFCGEVPTGYCRWCGRFYCKNHGEIGCFSCRDHHDKLAKNTYFHAASPTSLGFILSLLWYVSFALESQNAITAYQQLPVVKLIYPNGLGGGYTLTSTLFSIGYLIALAILWTSDVWKKDKFLEIQYKNRSVLFKISRSIFGFIYGFLLQPLFPFILIAWLFNLLELLRFRKYGRIPPQEE